MNPSSRSDTSMLHQETCAQLHMRHVSSTELITPLPGLDALLKVVCPSAIVASVLGSQHLSTLLQSCHGNDQSTVMLLWFYKNENTLKVLVFKAESYILIKCYCAFANLNSYDNEAGRHATSNIHSGKCKMLTVL